MNKVEFVNLDYKKIYNIERKNNEDKLFVDVLNTFVFFAIEFNPTNVLEKINNFI